MWHICSTKYVTVTFYIQSPDGNIKLSPDFSSNDLKRSSEMFFYVFFEKSIISRFRIQVYTRLNDFEVRNSKNFLGRGSPSLLPRPLPPFFLGLRPRFGLRPIRTPQLLNRGCALECKEPSFLKTEHFNKI